MQVRGRNLSNSVLIGAVLIAAIVIGALLRTLGGASWIIIIVVSVLYAELMLGVMLRERTASRSKTGASYSRRGRSAAVLLIFNSMMYFFGNVIGTRTVLLLIVLPVDALLIAIYFGWVWSGNLTKEKPSRER